MGSQAQDTRHELLLEKCRNTVNALEREVNAKAKELDEIKMKLVEAKRKLEIQESIDIKRD